MYVPQYITAESTYIQYTSRMVRYISTNQRCGTLLSVRYRGLLAHTQLVVSIHGDVPHPGQRLVPALLDDLQITHLYNVEGRVG